MSEKPISLLRQRMTEDTPAAVVFVPSKLWIIQPGPLLTIECVRSSQQFTQHATFIKNSQTQSNADAFVLTSSPKQFPVWQGRDFNHQESVRSHAVQRLSRGLSRQSCLCDIFAMLNSLKSCMEQNVNSPI
jgi:hypothetical protein